MNTYTVHLLGPIRVSWESGEPPNFRSQRTKALLGYVAAEQRPVSRDALAALIWPDETLSKGKTNLRKEVYNLQNILPDCWDTDDKTIQFLSNTAAKVDIYEIKRLAGAEQWSEAAEFIQGDFLEGIYLEDNLEFETWLLGERERQQQRAEQVLMEAAKTKHQQGHYPKARHHLTRLLQLLPWHEEAHRRMMRLLAYEGKFSAALKHYEQCRSILAEELDVAPSIETTKLNERIKVAMMMPPHNLPPQVTPFIGREEEVSTLKRHLANPNCRLLTLSGVGGIGKTRLALEVANQLAADDFRLFLHGVAFVSLAGVDGQDLLTAVGTGLGIVFSGQQPAEKQLLTYLRDMEIMILVDNYEHLLPETALFSAILRETPDVKMLVTSRERLNLHEEWLYDVEGLPYPKQETNELAGVDAMDFAAVHMFTSCAERAHRAGSLATAGQEVAAICRLVQGMPLALELSAARLRSLTPADVMTELERGLDILTAETHNIPPRHASLRAAFDASWAVLSIKEQRALSQLSLFRGGFTRDSAAEVAGATLPILNSLTDKSLIRLTPSGRYEMHELLRQYAAEKLAANPPVEAIAQEQFASYYGAFLQKREQRLMETNQEKALMELTPEMDNIRLAWRWLVENERIEILDASLWTLAFFQVLRGQVNEGLVLVEYTLTRIAPLESRALLEKRLCTRLRLFQGSFLYYAGRRVEARDLLSHILDQLHGVGIAQDIGWALLFLGRISWNFTWQLKGDDWRSYCEEGITTVRSSGPRWLDGFLTAQFAYLLAWEEDRQSLVQAEKFVMHALSIGRQLDNPYIIYEALFASGALATTQEAYIQAQQDYEQAFKVAQNIDNPFLIGDVLLEWGFATYLQGMLIQARQYTFESILCFRRIGARRMEAYSRKQMGDINRAEGEIDQAFEHFRTCLAISEDLGEVPPSYWVVTTLGHVLLRLLRLEGAIDSFHYSLTYLADMEDKNITSHLHSLNQELLWFTLAGVAGTLVARGQIERAAQLAGVAATCLSTSPRPFHPADRQDWERIVSEIKSALDDETFTAAWNEGQKMSLEHAIAYALEVTN